MSLAVRHAWLQKHPTPSAAAGEFHWHGEGAPQPDDAALRGRVVEEVQRLAAPAVWWELSPRRVIWAAVFSATSPTDARPYRGVALTVATSREGSLAAMLEELRLAAPTPWRAAASDAADAAAGARASAATGARANAAAGTTGHGAGQRAALATRAGAHDAEVARAILSGGAATVEDPHDPSLPAQLARLVQRLPAALAGRTVSGQLTDAATTMLQHDGGDAVAELLARAWRSDDEPGRAAGASEPDAAVAAWHLLCELAERDARAGAAARSLRAEVVTALLDELMLESQRALAVRFPDRAGKRFARALRAWAGRGPGGAAAAPPASWRQLLHGWGRGWTDEPGGGPEGKQPTRGDLRAGRAGATGATGAPEASDAQLLPQLAEELALRALAELCRGGQAQTVLAEARWHALLPAPRRQALWQALAQRAPSLADEAPFPRLLQRCRRESIDAS